ncbi:hypothetical protein EVAR_61788_1 [Eumeta japonica]|uniref:Uncharacterized protein n=1 Tax=Eumeta variegata TaxID=151549 RepID=A0A4C1Z1I3_EUMVA|nr:hypothetical protein EVAR_61788_1 [Eumeta japonica]
MPFLPVSPRVSNALVAAATVEELEVCVAFAARPTHERYLLAAVTSVPPMVRIYALQKPYDSRARRTHARAVPARAPYNKRRITPDSITAGDALRDMNQIKLHRFLFIKRRRRSSLINAASPARRLPDDVLEALNFERWLSEEQLRCPGCERALTRASLLLHRNPTQENYLFYYRNDEARRPRCARAGVLYKINYTARPTSPGEVINEVFMGAGGWPTARICIDISDLKRPNNPVQIRPLTYSRSFMGVINYQSERVSGRLRS